LIPLINPYRFSNGSGGSWKELGRWSDSGQPSVSSLDSKRYLMVLIDKPSGNNSMGLQFNGDTTGNYASRRESNGNDGQVTRINQSAIPDSSWWFSTHQDTTIAWISNFSTKEKLTWHFMYSGLNSQGNSPQWYDIAGKWANTSNSISSIKCNGTGFPSGSEMVVLGYDPSDTHTSDDNFWQELASATSTTDNLSTGTFSAKKYLWVQCYIVPDGSVNVDMTYNNDTGANYGVRSSYNGGNSGVGASQNFLDVGGTTSTPLYLNMYILNKSAKWKLSMEHLTYQNTATVSNTPNRQERSSKWYNTAEQITEIDFDNGGIGSFGTGTIVKVWGSD
jgi:hypothetical protein